MFSKLKSFLQSFDSLFLTAVVLLVIRAPENFLKKQYGLSADVWSFSLVLWAVATLAIPYENMTTTELTDKVMNGNERPSLQHQNVACSPELQELIQACWDVSPERRPTFKTICNILQDKVSSAPQGNNMEITSNTCVKRFGKKRRAVRQVCCS